MSEWTISTLKEHYDELFKAREKFENERDRRYAEVAIEREKALKIKETADLTALSLARDIQIYKDTKANELREQINSERGLYATNERLDTALKPINEYVSSQQGRGAGLNAGWGYLVAAAGLAAVVFALLDRLAK